MAITQTRVAPQGIVVENLSHHHRCLQGKAFHRCSVREPDTSHLVARKNDQVAGKNSLNMNIALSSLKCRHLMIFPLIKGTRLVHLWQVVPHCLTQMIYSINIMLLYCLLITNLTLVRPNPLRLEITTKSTTDWTARLTKSILKTFWK